MGFPVEYIFLPKLLTYTLSLLEIVEKHIFYILRFLGISHFLEPESFSHIQEHHTPESSESPLSAILIRELLPATKFSGMLRSAHGSRDGEQPAQCAVCLYEFRDDEEIRILKNCQHIFHKNCIDCWMDHDRRTCPLCRKSLVPVDLQDEYNHRLCAASCSDYDLDGED
ncbi:hypothetical protein LIER_16845 [Lithospermum erythrorhizon]|uniref:RING-type domain-containing protein n=1 Tax=Lithospermum erythrorhizon TaxID=34254 RepID=A0AAV3QBF9_LITER